MQVIKSLVSLLLILVSAAPAFAAQCGKAEEPTPNGGCIRVCPPGDYHIEKQNGYNTCIRDGNATVTAHAKYAFVSLTEQNTTITSASASARMKSRSIPSSMTASWTWTGTRTIARFGWQRSATSSIPRSPNCTSRQRDTTSSIRTKTLPGSAALRSLRMWWCRSTIRRSPTGPARRSSGRRLWRSRITLPSHRTTAIPMHGIQVREAGLRSIRRRHHRHRRRANNYRSCRAMAAVAGFNMRLLAICALVLGSECHFLATRKKSPSAS
jgi:hypothetical protein